MKKTKRTYLPAAGLHWLLPLYDPLVKLLGVDSDKRRLVDQSNIQPGQHILDIGCGTGSLVLQIKRLYKDVEIVGLDPDPKALIRARRKAKRNHLSVRFDRGFSDELPYADESFDLVFSSFMFHHLEAGEKEGTLSEVHRVLKPGGSLFLLDFGHSESQQNRGDSFLSRRIHSTHRLNDNSENRILTMMNKAGFLDLQEVNHRTWFFTQIVSYRATVPKLE